MTKITKLTLTFILLVWLVSQLKIILYVRDLRKLLASNTRKLENIQIRLLVQEYSDKIRNIN